MKIKMKNSIITFDDIKLFESDSNFSRIKIKAWEVLFDEWENNSNLYIIVSWKFSVEKYIWKSHNQTRKLSLVSCLDILWEWSLKNNNPKQVKVVAVENSELLCIDWRSWIKKFIEDNTDLWLKLLTHIIDIMHWRTLEANSIITATYEINKKISDIDKVDFSVIFWIIDDIKDIIWCDYIVFLEKNEFIDNAIILRYNTMFKWKMLDDVLSIDEWIFNPNSVNKLKCKYNHSQKLNIWDNILWYLVFFKNDEVFNEREIKIISSIAPSLSWVVKQKNINKQQNYKDYSWY